MWFRGGVGCGIFGGWSGDVLYLSRVVIDLVFADICGLGCPVLVPFSTLTFVVCARCRRWHDLVCTTGVRGLGPDLVITVLYYFVLSRAGSWGCPRLRELWESRPHWNSLTADLRITAWAKAVGALFVLG